jgi:multiple sugar transport system permease protein
VEIQAHNASGVGVRRRSFGSVARREAIEGYLFILPWILGLIIFTAGPFIAGIFFSFTNYSALETPTWVGVDNYSKVLQDQNFYLSIYNTVYYVILSVPTGLILALILALLLNQSVRGVSFFRTAFYMPSIVPAVPSIMIFLWILNGRFGLLNGALSGIGIVGPDWLTDPAWTKPSLVIWSLWQIGGSMIIFLAGLQGVPQELYEAASIDGAGTFKRFLHVTIPMISPTIFFVLVIGLIASFQVFTAAFILGTGNYGMPGSGPLNSLLFWVVNIYQQGFYFYRFGYASALACLLFIVVMVATLVQVWLAGRWVYYETDTGRTS